jgi:hypothetical protein
MPVRSPFRVLILVLFFQAALISASGAQRAPRRPKLPDGADTNDACVYYQHGVDVLRRNPGTAEQAFYWAHRLSPDWPDPLYGQWIASLISRSNRLPEYLNGERGVVRSKEYRMIDSLYYAALARNPFLYRRFDRMLFDEYIEVYARRYESRTGQMVDRGLLQHEFDRDVMSDPAMRGWMTYAQGMFDQAIAAYTQALKGDKY